MLVCIRELMSIRSKRPSIHSPIISESVVGSGYWAAMPYVNMSNSNMVGAQYPTASGRTRLERVQAAASELIAIYPTKSPEQLVPIAMDRAGVLPSELAPEEIKMLEIEIGRMQELPSITAPGARPPSWGTQWAGSSI